jgi:hypothetical protein
MKELEMDKEIRNAQAISSLKEDVEKVRKSKGVILKFSPYVIYQHNGFEEREQLVVRVHLTSFDYGNIDMDEGKRIINDTHHLGFLATKENYAYDETNKIFTITGSSAKMGDYKVLFLIDENI